MEEKITIIEGPPPTFEEVADGWAVGLNEGPFLYDLMLTRLRTFNGPALVERCYRVWNNKSNIYLHYRNELGLEEKAPIMAARSLDTSDGGVILLWVRLQPEDVEIELGFEDELNDEDDDEEFISDEELDELIDDLGSDADVDDDVDDEEDKI